MTGTAENRFARGPVVAVTAALSLTVAALTLIALRRPFWFDELFTLTVARQPTLAAVVNALLQGADNHAPLDYLIRHLSLLLPGPEELTLRLPSVLASAVLGACMFLFVYRRAGLTAGVTALFLPFTTSAVKHAPEGRPYALLLAFTGISMVAWQALGRTRKPAVNAAALCLSLAAAINTHYYGVLLYPAIASAEMFRWWKLGRRSWWAVGALACSLPAGLLALPFARAASQYSATFWSALGPPVLPQAYATLFAGATLLILVTAGLLAAGRTPDTPEPAVNDSDATACDMVLSVCLLATVPLCYLIAVGITRAFIYRYAIVAVGGLSVALPLMISYYGRCRFAQQALLCATLALFVVNIGYQLRPASWPNGSLAGMRNRLTQALANAPAPLVWGDTMECFALTHYFPDIAGGRVFCLAGPVTRGTIDRAANGLAPWSNLPIIRSQDFYRSHDSFIIAQPQDVLIDRSVQCSPAENQPAGLRMLACRKVSQYVYPH